MSRHPPWLRCSCTRPDSSDRIGRFIAEIALERGEVRQYLARLGNPLTREIRNAYTHSTAAGSDDALDHRRLSAARPMGGALSGAQIAGCAWLAHPGAVRVPGLSDDFGLSAVSVGGLDCLVPPVRSDELARVGRRGDRCARV